VCYHEHNVVQGMSRVSCSLAMMMYGHSSPHFSTLCTFWTILRHTFSIYIYIYIYMGFVSAAYVTMM
jgi:hypothetical protein